MQNCFQFKTQSVYEHGQSVRSYYKDLIDHLQMATPLDKQWKLPDWIYDARIPINLLPDDILLQYQVYHDCGKPYCRTVDELGKHHFPNHAQVSGDVWRRIGGDEQVARLIEMDMHVHLLKPDDMAAFSRNKEAVSLLLTGLSELHSNCQMFGGIESVSFKIKWKQINKNGKRLLENFS